MTSVRAPGVAGTFYPDDPQTLSALVAELTATAPESPTAFKAIVAPHAGYQYSGAVAGTAYAAIRHLAPQIRRVVLMGPAHRVGFRGIATSTDDALATPLGVIPVDRAAIASLAEIPGVHALDRAFVGEHALEVQLPFLQHVLRDFQIVPLLIGDTRPDHVDRVLERLWDGPETLIVVSSDLSHFQDYGTARRLDLTTSQAIEALAANRLNGHAACGFLPVSGLLRRAAALDLRATTLALCNSGDTAGGHDRVVGYGAYGFEYAFSARLPEIYRVQLLQAARRGLVEAAAGRAVEVDPASYPLPLRAVRRTFVTLTQQGRLRGCIGTLTATSSLVEDVVQNAIRAGMQDPRFKPMTPEEIEATDISVSILSHPRPIIFTNETNLLDQLRPDVDGLIIRDQDHQALFLPKVWHDLPMPAQFLHHLKLKAGLPPGPVSPTFQAFRFTTETF